MKLPYRAAAAQSASAQQAFLLRLTWKRIVEEPWNWARLMAWKLAVLGNGVEVPRNSNLYADRQYSTVLSALLSIGERLTGWL